MSKTVDLHAAFGHHEQLTLTATKPINMADTNKDGMYREEARLAFQVLMDTLPSGTLTEMRRLFVAHPSLKAWDEQELMPLLTDEE